MVRATTLASLGLLFTALAACGDDDATPCMTSADCPIEMTCRDGRCSARIDAGPLPDAGSDATDLDVPIVPFDAGFDAGFDGGEDAGEVDAGDAGEDAGLDAGPMDSGLTLPDEDGDGVPDSVDRCPTMRSSPAFYEGFELGPDWVTTGFGPLPGRFHVWPVGGPVSIAYAAGASLPSSLEPGTLGLEALADSLEIETRVAGASAETALPSELSLRAGMQIDSLSGHAIAAIGIYRTDVPATPARGWWCGVRIAPPGDPFPGVQVMIWLNLASSPFATSGEVTLPTSTATLELLSTSTELRCSFGDITVTQPRMTIIGAGVAIATAVGPDESEARVRFDDLTLQDATACP